MAPLCLGAAALASAVCALSLGTPYVPPAGLPAALGADGLAGLVVTELQLPPGAGADRRGVPGCGGPRPP
ncbi:hypothetical protein ABTX86_33545, partial [Streptomyces anulatus]